MKQNKTYRVLFVALALCAMLSAIVSCIKEEKLRPIVKGTLFLLPELFDDGANTISETKAVDDTDIGISAGDDVDARVELHETLIETLDIFVMVEGAAESTPWISQYHLSQEDADAILDTDEPGGLLEKAKHLLNANWAADAANYDPDTQYHVYVTANNPHTHSCNHSLLDHYSYRESGSTVPANLAELKALSTYDGTLDRFYTTEPVVVRTSRTNTKAFLMDGDTVWQPEPEAGDQIIDVDLKRAVSKIVVNLNMDPDFVNDELTANHWSAGAPMWRYVHFGFETADIASGTYTLDMDNVGNPYNTVPFKTGSLYTMEGDPSAYQYQVVTYSAPFKWADYTKTPYLLVSIRYTYMNEDDPADPLNTTQKTTYYHIPVCDEQAIGDVGILRNNIYLVDATIASWGAENEELEPADMQLRIEYHVVPWTETNMSHEATVVRLSDVKYLTVYPTEYTLKGDGVQKVDLNWYASVSTDDGRFVDIDLSSVNVSYENYQGTVVDITGSSSTTSGITNRIYKTPSSPDGAEDINIISYAPSGTANSELTQITVTTDGIITVRSKALDNRAVKVITFRVKLNESGLYKDVTIHHFPMDNIQRIEGLWSSRIPDGDNYSWVVWGSYNSGKRYVRDDVFRAKVYYNGSIYYINYPTNAQDTGTSSDYIGTHGYYITNTTPSRGNNANYTNRSMYVIQITSASDDYVIGYPTLTDNASNDNVVSPAFMLASQLGVITKYNTSTLEGETEANFTLAKNHCATYMEVGTDGYEYKNWRLPTAGEIGVIIKYQDGEYTSGTTMVEVLTSRYYWNLSGTCSDLGSGKNNDTPTATDQRSTWIRCVRDLTLAEIQALNGD